jgi:FlaG/FlaF family flagellin (archaellin)
MKSFRRCSKGFSTVIGTIFLVLIALTVASSVFLYTFAQNAAYNQAVKESGQMDADRYSERVVAYNTEYSVSTNKILVNTTITSQGPLSAQIIRIWVTCKVGGNTHYGSLDTEISVPSGQTITIEELVDVPGALTSELAECDGWLITGRGNRVPLELEELGETIIVANVAQGIGSVSMDFTKFRYYTINAGQLQNFPEGNSAIKVLTKADTYMSVVLTNYDPLERTLTLSSDSLIWVYFPDTGNRYTWKICAVDENGFVTNYDNNNPIILPYKASMKIYFGPANLAASISGVSGAVNLLLLGTIGADQYGQNIPFIAIVPQ